MQKPRDRRHALLSLLARIRPEVQAQLGLDKEQQERLVKYLAELLLEAAEMRGTQRMGMEGSDE